MPVNIGDELEIASCKVPGKKSNPLWSTSETSSEFAYIDCAR
jgi:hypothetical protein